MQDFIRLFYKIVVTCSIFFFDGCHKDDPAPVLAIVDFSPSAGVSGTKVTITGAKFSSTPSENVVNFSSGSRLIAAQVISATSTQLEVTVPSGVVTGRISVTVKDKTVISSNDFGIFRWVSRADFPVGRRWRGVGFAIGENGYISTGSIPNNVNTNDLWEYNTTTNTWTQKPSLPGPVRSAAAGFVINNKGYVGTGANGCCTLYNDLWEYNPATNTWAQKANLSDARNLAIGFAIGGKGYFSLGGSVVSEKVLWQYDPATDAWTQKADFGGEPRHSASSFVIGDKGYVGGGDNAPTFYKDFWQYDPAANTWARKADLNVERTEGVAFSLGDKGYIGTGYNVAPGASASTKFKDFWEYDPANDTWVKIADFPTVRCFAVAFSTGTRAFVGMGTVTADDRTDFWELTTH